MNDYDIEQEIKTKRMIAPRVTPADIELAIASEHYFTAGDAAYPGDTAASAYPGDIPGTAYERLRLLTFCVLVLRNGFTVTGESACASPENFDAELGRKIARIHATDKIWPLLGYAMRERLSEFGR